MTHHDDSSAAGRWDLAYQGGSAPWDIGRPQPTVVQLTDAGAIRAPVLDAGCGTGENTLHVASRGHEVVGVDHAPTAIERAQAKARERQVSNASFVVGDALQLDQLGRRFATALDWGLYHTFDPVLVPRYVVSLHAALSPDATLYLMCFSEREPGDWGPRRVTEDELRTSFANGWRIESLERSTFAAGPPASEAGAQAWLACITRLEPGSHR